MRAHKPPGAIPRKRALPKINAREATQKSEAACKACLAANPPTPQNHEGGRLAREAGLQRYEASSAGIRPGSTVTVLGFTP